MSEQKLDDIDKLFNELYEESFDIIGLDDKKLSEALKQQVDLELMWGRVFHKAKVIVDEYEQLVEEKYSDAVTAELKDSYRSSSITEAKEFAKTDPTYRQVKRTYVRAKALHDEIRDHIDVVKSRRYVLNNLTNSKVASVDDTIL